MSGLFDPQMTSDGMEECESAQHVGTYGMYVALRLTARTDVLAFVAGARIHTSYPR